MNLCLASFASTSRATVQPVLCLGYGLAYREMWAVILGSDREGFSLLHGIDLLLGRTRRPLQCIRGPFSAYKDESLPHVLAEVQNMLFVTSNPPPLPPVRLHMYNSVKHNNELVFSVPLDERTGRDKSVFLLAMGWLTQPPVQGLMVLLPKVKFARA